MGEPGYEGRCRLAQSPGTGEHGYESRYRLALSTEMREPGYEGRCSLAQSPGTGEPGYKGRYSPCPLRVLHALLHLPSHTAHIPLFLYPFLHTVTKSRPFEYLRLTSLGVVGALVKVSGSRSSWQQPHSQASEFFSYVKAVTVLCSRTSRKVRISEKLEE